MRNIVLVTLSFFLSRKQRPIPRGGSGTQQMFTRGGSSPEVQPLTLLYTIFHENGIPFVYMLLTNGTPFTHLVEKFASLLTAVNALSFI